MFLGLRDDFLFWFDCEVVRNHGSYVYQILQGLILFNRKLGVKGVTSVKSPLKAKPLNNPGESLDRKLQDVLYDEIFYSVLISVFVVIMTLVECLRWYMQAPPSPLVYAVAAGIVCSYSAWKVRKALKKVKNIKLGRDGEKAVGQFLESLRESGAKIFHDIQGEKFNLDHVVIHSSGIYVIETKTLSKPNRGEAKLVFDGSRVLKNNTEMDRNAIIQVTAASGWLRELLQSSTGHKFPIRPVVVYPGWFIQPTIEAKSSDVWVLNPKALPAFISNSKATLSSEQVNMCSHHLSKHIRAS